MRGGVSPDIGKATRIKPGEVRNPTGKNGQNPITEALKEVFGEHEEIVKTLKGILKGKSAMAKVLLIEEAGERIEGKVATPVKISGELHVSLTDELNRAEERAERIRQQHTHIDDSSISRAGEG